MRCDKGKPAAKQGRKAYGPPRASFEEVAGSPNSVAGLERELRPPTERRHAMPTEDHSSDRSHQGLPQGEGLDVLEEVPEVIGLPKRNALGNPS